MRKIAMTPTTLACLICAASAAACGDDDPNDPSSSSELLTALDEYDQIVCQCWEEEFYDSESDCLEDHANFRESVGISTDEQLACRAEVADRYAEELRPQRECSLNRQRAHNECVEANLDCDDLNGTVGDCWNTEDQPIDCQRDFPGPDEMRVELAHCNSL